MNFSNYKLCLLVQRDMCVRRASKRQSVFARQWQTQTRESNFDMAFGCVFHVFFLAVFESFVEIVIFTLIRAAHLFCIFASFIISARRPAETVLFCLFLCYSLIEKEEEEKACMHGHCQWIHFNRICHIPSPVIFISFFFTYKRTNLI